MNVASETKVVSMTNMIVLLSFIRTAVRKMKNVTKIK